MQNAKRKMQNENYKYKVREGRPLPYDRRTDSPVLNPRRRLGISSAKLYIITRRRAYHHRRCISSAKLYKN
ncbi:MAG: hypothetical protein IKB08_07830, partial [Clostridia bacterium]|nr:hypothetical protein [Clostridia bacterium]